VFRVYLICVVIAAAIAVRYTFACYIRPFADCRRCDGLGKTRRKLARSWRPCRRCRSTGKRLRHGRRAFNYLTKTRRTAKAADRTTSSTRPTISTGNRR
jgi:hypothetical protein